MEPPLQPTTEARPIFQFRLADIFVATAFFAGAVLAGIYFYRATSGISAERWYMHAGVPGRVMLARLLGIAGCSCIGGAIGALMRKPLVGMGLGALAGFAAFGHWVPG